MDFPAKIFQKTGIPNSPKNNSFFAAPYSSTGLAYLHVKESTEIVNFSHKGRITWFQGLTKFSRTLHLKWKANLIQKSPYVSFMVDNKL